MCVVDCKFYIANINDQLNIYVLFAEGKELALACKNSQVN